MNILLAKLKIFTAKNTFAGNSIDLEKNLNVLRYLFTAFFPFLFFKSRNAICFNNALS